MRPAALFTLVLVLVSAPVLAEDDPLAEARRHYELRDHHLAEEALLHRLSATLDDVDAMKLLIEVYLVTGRHAEARAIHESALKAAPEDPEILATAWEIRLHETEWSEATKARVRETAASIAAKAAGDTEITDLTTAYLGFGLLNEKAEKAKIAARILKLGPEKVPEMLEGDLFEGIIVEKRVDERAALIHQFLALYPESQQQNYVREILLYTVRNDRKRLLAEADAILAKDPDNRRVRAALARWLLEGDEPDAKRAFLEAERAYGLLNEPREIDRPELTSDEDWNRMIQETAARYRAYLGRSSLLSGDLLSARVWLTQATRDPELTNSRTWLWLGELEEAQAAEENLVRKRRDLVIAAVEAYARAVAAGESPEAEAHLRRLVPEGTPIRDRVSEITGPAPRFVDATGSMGLGDVRAGRVSLADVNGDGYPDMLLNGSKLYLNREGKAFEPAPLPVVPRARGGIFADLDCDGDLDLFVASRAGPGVLSGDGKGGFTVRTPDALKSERLLFTEGAAVLDFDGDGLLDLYLANYERPPHPPWARGTGDILYRNLGEFRFEDATDRISGVSLEPMCGRGCAVADFDDDGDTDLYVANYRLDPDFLLVNRGEGGLVNEARARGTEGECDKGYFGHGIGPAFGDLNGDGHLDVVVGNLAHPRYIGFSDLTRIFLSSGPPDYTFRDVFRESGVRFEETHSNASLGDVDLDGDLDLFLTSIYRGRKSFLYLNDGKASFRDATWLAGVRADNGWGSAFGDLDRDGDLDLVVGSGSGMRVYRNAGPAGGYIGVTLAGTESNATGIGARVTLTGAGAPQVREVGGGTGTGCQDDPSLRFGIGESKGPFTLTVRWPGGLTQRIMGVKPNRLYRLAEGGNLLPLN